jgi:nicotinamidase-related amidase
VIPKLVALIERWRRMRRPVVHVMRIYQSDGGNVDLCRRSLVRSGTRILAPASKGAEIVPALVPEDLSYRWEELLSGDPMPIADREWVMYKPRWSAFQDTGLGDLLTGLQSTTVVIAGCNFPNCPRSTIYDATARDFRTVLVADATSGSYERGLEELAGIGVNVLDTDFCLAA